MNDAVFALPDVERDALGDALVDPVVPVAPVPSPGCKQPVTVIVPLFAALCDAAWLLPSWAATIAVHPKPIANIHAARFIRRLLFVIESARAAASQSP
jgi:hypothetical protein